MLRRIRLTPQGMLGLALVAAFLASVYWMNAPQPPPNHALLPGIESGGLGLTRSEWNERHNTVGDISGATVRHLVTPTQRALIYFMPQEASLAQYVQRFDMSVNFVGAPRVSEEDARTLGMSLLPSDAAFARRISRPVPHFRIVTTDILTSESLERAYWTVCVPEQYPALYRDVERGSIHITIERDSGGELPYLVTVSWNCYRKSA